MKRTTTMMIAIALSVAGGALWRQMTEQPVPRISQQAAAPGSLDPALLDCIRQFVTEEFGDEAAVATVGALANRVGERPAIDRGTAVGLALLGLEHRRPEAARALPQWLGGTAQHGATEFRTPTPAAPRPAPAAPSTELSRATAPELRAALDAGAPAARQEALLRLRAMADPAALD